MSASLTLRFLNVEAIADTDRIYPGDQDVVVYRNAGAATVTIAPPTLPQANHIYIKNLSADRATLEVDPIGGAMIDDSFSNLAIAWPDSAHLIWDGSSYLNIT